MKCLKSVAKSLAVEDNHELHQFLSRKDFQQGQQHHTILDVLKQVCHHQGWDVLYEKTSTPMSIYCKKCLLSFLTIC